ncbi:proteasome lid subunit RPN8/RPN11 [Bradyrhizobium sp. USDA 4524]|uniref:Mov34/MPN/PAD-1 family protein n=1 Tax=unclassified Bradyrhizobium TaxID=2631580 RepID=UPI0020A16CA0|nr:MULTISPECIES: Mov34/MPN/PAD-1 family protein [unclassified Bradyrhizobium]MCP1843663.1 proteasome lid subunit RPN8/RPN11 [Bradyrhizobium sp. USDA 4538]MCP1904229.1 proteasome lid subunit RPN8/RPN11 [Bradyrhizobium sp. USDA 4537]MCP1990115.1 proteasome lid subunit RPN8/RPN11 [Bradyrhizobium sp. USDA 4539]
MKLILPADVVSCLRKELRSAGTREIGGVLVGEHMHNATFRVADLSVQRSGGSVAHFVRDVEQSSAFLKEFFARTGNDYQRFNYLGEWHSHPQFSALPSGQDLATMLDIVESPDVGAHFAVLLIVSLRRRGLLELSALAFRPGISPVNVDVVMEDETGATRKGWLRRIIDLFRS